MQFHTQLKGRGRLTSAIHAHIAGRYTFNRAIVVVEDFSSREAREYFYPQRFGLLAQPAHDVGQRDHVIAMVLEAGRQYKVRRLVSLFLGQEQEAVFANSCVQRWRRVPSSQETIL